MASIFYINIFGLGLADSGNDSNFYNQYALGIYKPISSLWPEMLRSLHHIGFYNRSVISSILFILGSLIIPFLFASLLPKPISNTLKKTHQKTYWFVATIISIYPTIFYFSLDIYRDVVMVFMVGICLHVVKTLVNTPVKKSILILLIFSLLSYLLYLFRPYLGISIFAALFMYRLELSKQSIIYLGVSFFGLLTLSYSMGLLDPLVAYRELFFLKASFGASNLNISFANKTSVEFLCLFLHSTLLQLFGFYLISLKTFFVFVCESILFILCVLYSIKNWRYSSPFLQYLLFFSIIYGTIWIIGNDNFGTAVRLRIFNYLAMLIIATTIYFNKHYMSDKGGVNPDN